MSNQAGQAWHFENGVGKQDVRTQFATLCYRVKNDRVQVLLVTSRRTKRWIIPKGWPMPGQTPEQAAAMEAWEEGGVKGLMDPRPLGMFSYVKDMADKDDLPCAAVVYAMKVSKIANDYPEKSERRRKWVSRKKAAAMVNSVELARIIKDFSPAHFRRG